jgi:hypothetical protein
MSRHIFVDNSNIYGGAQRAAAKLEPGAVSMAVRVYYRNFFQLVEAGGADIATRALAGSVPPGSEPLWQTARDLGYNTDLLKRVESDTGRLAEQAVDEMLHLKIANTLLDYNEPQTLVIGSGDGRVSDFDTSFPGQAERALKRGWTIEVWSWSEQLTRAYAALQDAYPGRVHVSALDPYYFSITFVKEGIYRIRGAEVSVAPRIVSALR